jgi:hypothetical protein
MEIDELEQEPKYDWKQPIKMFLENRPHWMTTLKLSALHESLSRII